MKGSSKTLNQKWANDGNNLKPITNNDLTCANCILRHEGDMDVLSCHRFSIKPNVVLDGGKCTEKIKNF